MIDRLLYLGFTHHSTPIDVRERVAPAADRRTEFRAMIRRHAAESVVVTTCGRFELYALTPEPEPLDREDRRADVWLDRVLDFPTPSDRLGPSRSEVRACARVLRGIEAARHLLRVGAGLDSRILGEDHILGQVRRSFLEAQEAGATGPILSALFRAAIHAGRRVRREADLNGAALSFAKLAAREILNAPAGAAAPASGARNDSDVIGALRSSDAPTPPREGWIPPIERLLVIGCGAMARETLYHLRRRAFRRVVVASRHVERAQALADPFQGRGVPSTEIPAWFDRVDAVLACTASSRFVIDATMFNGLRDRPRLLIDLGMPRNIDPLVGRLPGVTLKGLEDLTTDGGATRRAIAQVEAVVEEELRRFRVWLGGRAAADRIVRLLRRGAEAASDPVRKRAVHRRILALKEAAA